MKLFLIFLLITADLICFGQSKKFQAQVNDIFNMLDEPEAIVSVQPSNEPYNFLANGTDQLEQIFISSILEEHKKGKVDFQKSQTLTRLAEAASNAWKGSHYSDRKKWTGLSKYFNRAKVNLPTNFNIIESFSCRINLMDFKGKGFYYDRKGVEKELNLYKGKKPNTPEEEEMEKIPLPFQTEQGIEIQLKNELKKRGYIRKLNKGIYSFVGVSIKVDQNSLFRTKLPTARVVVFFGARRLQNLRL